MISKKELLSTKRLLPRNSAEFLVSELLQMRLPGLKALLTLSDMTQDNLTEVTQMYQIREFPIKGRAYVFS